LSPDDDDTNNNYEICVRSTDNNSEYVDVNMTIKVILELGDAGDIIFHLDAQDVDGDGILYTEDTA